MLRYIIRRVLALFPVLILVSLFAFIIVHVTPGDPVALVLGDQATDTQIAEARRELGLDDPIYVQYFRWLGSVVQGDLGRSLIFDQPVSRMLVQRAEPTIVLASVALFFTVAIGIPAGVIAAINNNRWSDHSVMIGALLFVATPNFVLGLLLIIFVALNVDSIPTGGYSHLRDGVISTLQSVILPAFALGASQAALVARMTRASLLEVLGTDYVRTARAKGLRNRAVYFKHALRNALLPTTTVLGVIVITLFGGAVVTEYLFNLPGIGRLIVNAVRNRDFPVVQGALIVVATMYVLINLLVDVLYVFIDPRIRYTD
jgi:peptide/nickel transport system permease protein